MEIREQVGAENFFLFGLSESEVSETLANGYNPWDIYHRDEELRHTIDLLQSGLFSHGDTQLFKPLIDNLLHHDPFLLLADYRSYVDTQQKVGEAFLSANSWSRMPILNVSRMGIFSSDRSIRDYCERIWKVKPTPVNANGTLAR